MIAPTFASFKAQKQNAQNMAQVPQKKINGPKSFHELKQQLHPHPPSLPILTYNPLPLKTPPVSLTALSSQRGTARKVKPQGEYRGDRDGRTEGKGRPNIAAPTLLSNRSLVWTARGQDGDRENRIECRRREDQQSKENWGHGHRPSDGCLWGPGGHGSVLKSLNSHMNSSTKSTTRMQKNLQETIYLGDISLSSMARELCSSFGSDSLPESVNSQYFQPCLDSSSSLSRKGSITALHSERSFRDGRNKSNMNIKRKFRFQDFLVVEELGQGKYGKVYMAIHKETNFICALKEIPKQKIKEENLIETLIHEIKIQSYLNHPNIVKLYGFFSTEDKIYLIMECCSDGHLLSQIKKYKIFDEQHILAIVSDVYEAVAFLHCHGIIHRDIKPENIVIQNGVYKICDFGWAAYAKGDSRSTFCGTPLYVCPEVLKGNQYDQKADIWGLGVLTYELAYGRVPFPIWSQADMIKIVKQPVYFPTWTSVSEKMQNLIKSMLNKDPRKRQGLNEIMASSLISEYVGVRLGVKSQIDGLF